MKRVPINVGWLGVATAALLGALACVECYVQESARLAATEQSTAFSETTVQPAR